MFGYNPRYNRNHKHTKHYLKVVCENIRTLTNKHD